LQDCLIASGNYGWAELGLAGLYQAALRWVDLMAMWLAELAGLCCAKLQLV
jgi:hypothetical protein